MTYIVNESCIRCKYTDCVEVCPVDCSTRARTCSSSTRMNASIAASASRNARLTLSSQTQSPASKSGSTSTANTRRFGLT